METRKFLVHYKYNGWETTQTFSTSRKANEETFKEFVRCWHIDRDKNLQIIIYGWSLIEE
jgi:hypothetical protein